MSEILLIACNLRDRLHLNALVPDGSYRQLAATGAAMLLGSLTRYEAWVVDVGRGRGDRLGCLAAPSPGRAARPAQPRPGRSHLLRHPGLQRHPGLDLAGTRSSSTTRSTSRPARFAKPSLWVSRHELAIGIPGCRAHLPGRHGGQRGLARLALALVGLGFYLVRSRHRADAVAPLTVHESLFPSTSTRCTRASGRSTSCRSTGACTTCASGCSRSSRSRCSSATWPRSSRPTPGAAPGRRLRRAAGRRGRVGGTPRNRGHRHPHRVAGVPGLRHQRATTGPGPGCAPTTTGAAC